MKNTVTLVGFVGNNPEVRTTQSGASITTVSLATTNSFKDSEGNRRAKRDDIGDAADFMGWYMDESARNLGISKDDAEAQYLAYHEGRTGYANQSYLNKPWLVEVAAKVGSRSAMYRDQLAYCR